MSESCLQKAAHVSSIVQTVVVVLALIVAFREFGITSSNEVEDKIEAVQDLLVRSYVPEEVSSSYYYLYTTPEETLKLADADYVDRVGALRTYFWSVSRCAELEICDEKTVLDTFCGDFLAYKNLERAKYGLDEPGIAARFEGQGFGLLQMKCSVRD